MKDHFARLDELLAKDEADFRAADSEDLERLAPLPVDPAYQEDRWALIDAVTLETGAGEFDGPPPANEVEQFTVCPQSGQALDARDLAQVLHHTQPGHEPIATDA
jgi:hypothetical protein